MIKQAQNLFFAFSLVTVLTPGLELIAQENQELPLQTRTPSYVMETARSVDKIQSTYPYDIQLLRLEGDTVLSTDVLPVNGKPTILLFWLTTCYPCKMELETLQKVYSEWKKETDFNLVAISTDFPKNYPAFGDRVRQSQWPWPAYIDLRREFGKILPGGLNGLPQTFILDAAGQIVYHKRKFRPGDEAGLLEQLKRAAKKIAD